MDEYATIRFVQYCSLIKLIQLTQSLAASSNVDHGQPAVNQSGRTDSEDYTSDVTRNAS
jgi:hypothetical protein